MFFDFSKSKLSTLSVTGGPITPQLTLAPSALPNADVQLQFVGFATPTESFVLSDTANDLSINDLHPTGETGTSDVGLVPGLEVAPYAPTATPDVVTTLENTSITISVKRSRDRPEQWRRSDNRRDRLRR